MRTINKAILHCSATPPHMNVHVAMIRVWHLERGFDDIGYHWLIHRDGTLEKGRDESEVGAHAYGYNQDSIGICLAGGVDDQMRAESNFTRAQYETLFLLQDDLDARYVGIEWSGHNNFADKACPSLNAKTLLAR